MVTTFTAIKDFYQTLKNQFQNTTLLRKRIEDRISEMEEDIEIDGSDSEEEALKTPYCERV